MDFVMAHGLDEALAARDAVPGSELLAGGTDLMVEVNLAHHRPSSVIALRHVPELQALESRRIGAGVTWGRLERSEYRALAQAARTVGSPQIRAAGTLGGNIGTASPAGDGLPWLAALDAEIEVASRTRGTRRVPWSDFFTGVKQTSLADDEIVTAAVLPDQMPDQQEFAKIGPRNAMVISVVSAVVMRWDGGTTRVALGSVAPTALRARQAEEMISAEANPSEASLEEFARLVAAEVRPITDHRATAEYRRHSAGVLARRLLERCLAA
jgi:CO/xanthine dehydrogenase FAD-binding subunit